jgi:hypothetical protein
LNCGGVRAGESGITRHHLATGWQAHLRQAGMAGPR